MNKYFNLGLIGLGLGVLKYVLVKILSFKFFVFMLIFMYRIFFEGIVIGKFLFL